MENSDWKKVKDLKRGEYFTLCEHRDPDADLVRVRGDYDRSTRRYRNHLFVDVNHDCRQLRGNTLVFVGFTF